MKGENAVGVGPAVRRACQITQWKSQLLEGAAGIVDGEAKAGPAEAAVDVKTVQAKIGQLTWENPF